MPAAACADVMPPLHAGQTGPEIFTGNFKGRHVGYTLSGRSIIVRKPEGVCNDFTLDEYVYRPNMLYRHAGYKQITQAVTPPPVTTSFFLRPIWWAAQLWKKS